MTKSSTRALIKLLIAVKALIYLASNAFTQIIKAKFGRRISHTNSAKVENISSP